MLFKNSILWQEHAETSGFGDFVYCSVHKNPLGFPLGFVFQQKSYGSRISRGRGLGSRSSGSDAGALWAIF